MIKHRRNYIPSQEEDALQAKEDAPFCENSQASSLFPLLGAQATMFELSIRNICRLTGAVEALFIRRKI